MDLKRLLNKLCNYFFHVLQFVLVDTTNESFISLQGVYHCPCSFAILLEIPLSLESFEKNRKMPCPNIFLLSCLAAGDLLFAIIAETNMFFLITGSKVRLQACLPAIERYLAILRPFFYRAKVTKSLVQKLILIILAFSAMV